MYNARTVCDAGVTMFNSQYTEMFVFNASAFNLNTAVRGNSSRELGGAAGEGKGGNIEDGHRSQSESASVYIDVESIKVAIVGNPVTALGIDSRASGCTASPKQVSQQIPYQFSNKPSNQSCDSIVSSAPSCELNQSVWIERTLRTPRQIGISIKGLRVRQVVAAVVGIGRQPPALGRCILAVKRRITAVLRVPLMLGKQEPIRGRTAEQLTVGRHVVCAQHIARAVRLLDKGIQMVSDAIERRIRSRHGNLCNQPTLQHKCNPSID